MALRLLTWQAHGCRCICEDRKHVFTSPRPKYTNVSPSPVVFSFHARFWIGLSGHFSLMSQRTVSIVGGNVKLRLFECHLYTGVYICRKCQCEVGFIVQRFSPL